MPSLVARDPAERELTGLIDHKERTEYMQRDKDTLLEQYEVLTLGALEDLTTEHIQSTNPFGLGSPEATLWVNRPGSTPAALKSSWPFASFVSKPPEPAHTGTLVAREYLRKFKGCSSS